MKFLILISFCFVAACSTTQKTPKENLGKQTALKKAFLALENDEARFDFLIERLSEHSDQLFDLQMNESLRKGTPACSN